MKTTAKYSLLSITLVGLLSACATESVMDDSARIENNEQDRYEDNAGTETQTPDSEEVTTQTAEPKADAGDKAALVEPAPEIEKPVIHFEFDSATLSATEKQKLKHWLGEIKNLPIKEVTISGHTDAIGDSDYNYQLSLERARSVHEALQTLDSNKLQWHINGYGEQRPLTHNETKDARQMNRRVEIAVDIEERNESSLSYR